MFFRRIDSCEGFHRYWKLSKWPRRIRAVMEKRLVPKKFPAAVRGVCHVCGGRRAFTVSGKDGDTSVHWRETLLCPECHLPNRLRAVVHFLDGKMRPKDAALYLTEQKTHLYKVLKKRFPQAEGSEYLGGECPLGSRNAEGIRNESLTELTFADESFDCILCLEVLEHIPNYEAAIRECARVLRPGGMLLFTVPFMLGTQDTLIRATADEGGNITHIQPAEYHGDPLKEEGCLCFYHFGWDMLDKIRQLGLAQCGGYIYWSRKFCYLGEPQALFMAKKAA